MAQIAEMAVPSVFHGYKRRDEQGVACDLRRSATGAALAYRAWLCSDDFGEQMYREAQRRRFVEAARRVFIGDGLAWNWVIWQKHFKTFTPILDFIHAIQYLYAVAAAWEGDGLSTPARYLNWRRPCGKVASTQL
ncbi:MAG: hypothetical protein U0935_24595 [Pirellulales bacterium]